MYSVSGNKIKSSSDRGKVTVEARKLDELILETYHRTPGLTPQFALELRDEYTFCLNTGYGGTYLYRGSSYSFPQNSLTILHPGEAHRPAQLNIKNPATYRMIYIQSDWLKKVAKEVSSTKSLPYFPSVTIPNSELTTELLKLHITQKRSLSTLEWESRLFSVLSKLVTHHSQLHRTSDVTVNRSAIERLKNYLQAHYSENISLSDLSKIAGLSPYHLCRTFSEVVGLPPHRYQTQLRIDRAKKLLLAGRSILYTASQVGFFDQSHFSRHFKRIVGVSPKKYRVLLD